MPKRRDILIGLGGAIPALGAARVRAAAKRGYCQPANGPGQCESHNVSHGVCYPTTNICADRRKRNQFACKNGAGFCCAKVRPDGTAKNCRPL